MKTRDFQVIIIVAIISLALSFWLSGVFFSSESDRSQTVETAEPITADFPDTDDRYFNEDAFNPAKEVEIGRDPASNPFRGN